MDVIDSNQTLYNPNSPKAKNLSKQTLKALPWGILAICFASVLVITATQATTHVFSKISPEVGKFADTLVENLGSGWGYLGLVAFTALTTARTYEVYSQEDD